jgi:hypothetical protein
LKNKGLEIVGICKQKLEIRCLEIVGICKQKLEIRCLEIVGSELYLYSNITLQFHNNGQNSNLFLS